MMILRGLAYTACLLSASGSFAAPTVDPSSDPRCPAAVIAGAIDTAKLEDCLQNQGLLLEVHGAVPENSIYVATYRAPGDFFLNLNLSLLGGSPEVKALLPKLHRHDFVLAKGKFEHVEAAQKHIRAKTLEITRPWDGAPAMPPYSREVVLPGELKDKTEFVGLVHAVHAGGEILVLEYRDAVIPVYVDEKLRTFTRDLSRGDKVRVHYVFQDKPSRVSHLNLNPAVERPLEVLAGVMPQHGQARTLQGRLILFPKSPQVAFNVFAINTDIGDDVRLNYTLVNFEDPALFKAIRDRLQQEWDAHPDTIRNDRNKLINDGIWVTVSGEINMIDPGQANPQILISKLSDLGFGPVPANAPRSTRPAPLRRASE